MLPVTLKPINSKGLKLACNGLRAIQDIIGKLNQYPLRYSRRASTVTMEQHWRNPQSSASNVVPQTLIRSRKHSNKASSLKDHFTYYISHQAHFCCNKLVAGQGFATWLSSIPLFKHLLVPFTHLNILDIYLKCSVCELAVLKRAIVNPSWHFAMTTAENLLKHGPIFMYLINNSI